MSIDPEAARRKLSPMQESILLHLWRLHQELEAQCEQIRLGPHPGYAARLMIWGVEWRTRATRCEQAALSRSLHRLEQRGLVLRQNLMSDPETGANHGMLRKSKGDPHDRTTNVVLLPAGIELAKRLTK